MINSLYHNEPVSVNQPRSWPWKDKPPRSLRRRKANRRGGSTQPPRRVVLDGPPSDRARVRRRPERGHYDHTTIDAVLDDAYVCHVATLIGDQPIVVPMMYARVGDQIYVHGSGASRLIRTLGAGAPVCVEVTHLDGLVLARSAMHHSMNYRSVVAYGTFARAEGDEKLAAMRALVERVAAGRWEDVRPPTRKELAATTILRMSLAEASAKVRTGGPTEEPEDLSLPVWAGEIPLTIERGTPIQDVAPAGALSRAN